MKKMSGTIESLFEEAGGSIKLAAYLDVNQWTVERWKKIGIPRKYWERIGAKYNITPAELYFISNKASRRAK